MQILVHLIFSPGPLNYPHYKNVFSFWMFWLGDLHYSVIQITYIFFCINVCSIFLLVCFSFQLSYSSVPEFYLVTFHSFISLMIFSFCSCIVSLISFGCLRLFVAHWTSLIFWILCHVIHKSPFLYNQFKEIYFVPLIWVT